MNEVTNPQHGSPHQGVAVRQESAAPVISEGPGALLGAIVQMAKDPAVDVTKLQALLQMQERMEVRQAEIEFGRALARLPPMHVKKSGMIDLTSKEDRAANRQRKPVPFAKWEDIARLIEPMLEAEGFRLMFDSQPRQGDGGGLIVTGTLLHRDGHSKTASMPLALDTGPGRNNLQAMGSSLSYGKRYCTEMLLNIVREGDDDDGMRGGMRFITEPQADELRAMAREVGRQEGPFLQSMFGDTVHSFDEIEDGPGYLAARNTLMALKRRKQGAAS